MDPDIPAIAPSASEVDAVNAGLRARGIVVRAPEGDDDGGWQVRIETAEGLTEFARGPTPSLAWGSALAWIGA